jgi:hypothetical protein
MQTWGQNYWETYAPVVNWASVHLLLAIAEIHGLPSKNIDFVLAFPQVNLEVPGYMELPMGFDAVHNESRKFYVLCLNKSLYGVTVSLTSIYLKLCISRILGSSPLRYCTAGQKSKRSHWGHGLEMVIGQDMLGHRWSFYFVSFMC